MSEVLSTAATAQISLPKSPLGVFELPCGYLDADGALHTEVEIREMTGEEEDLLTSNLIPTNKKMAELLVRCTNRVGPITDRGSIAKAIAEMPVGDRVFLMFAVRRVTLGDEYQLSTKCPECKQITNVTVNLSELEVRSAPNPKERVWDLKLPSGKLVRLKVLTGEGEEQIEKLSKRREGDRMSIGMLVRVDTLDGKPPTIEGLKALSSRDRNAIRKSFAEHDGGVETAVDYDCPHCGHQYKEDLNVQAGFFFPSLALKS